VSESVLVDRAALVERYRVVDSANIADVLDALGFHDQALGAAFGPVSGAGFAGFAFTLQGESGDLPRTKDELKFEACSSVGRGEVTVWAGGSAGGCYLGELIAVGLRERGCEGAVVEGAVRDVRWLEAAGFPVVATGRNPVQSMGHCRVVAYQTPILLPGAAGRDVEVHPGDLVRADEDGVVIVPAAVVEQVLEEAERLTDHEHEIRASLAEGLSLAECLARHGKV
jgi:4-hydroxy-4-methyl-2-oxoglutarate aldolase